MEVNKIMSEKMTLVRTHLVEYRCDKCNNGNMVQNGMATSTYPPRFGHVCQSCQHTEMFDQVYPVIKYEKLKLDDLKTIISN